MYQRREGRRKYQHSVVIRPKLKVESMLNRYTGTCLLSVQFLSQRNRLYITIVKSLGCVVLAWGDGGMGTDIHPGPRRLVLHRGQPLPLPPTHIPVLYRGEPVPRRRSRGALRGPSIPCTGTSPRRAGSFYLFYNLSSCKDVRSYCKPKFGRYSSKTKWFNRTEYRWFVPRIDVKPATRCTFLARSYL